MSDGKYRIKQFNAKGDLLKAREMPSVEAIANDQHADYQGSVEEACKRARERPGQWAQIILGPPMLAQSVDRLEIQAIL